MRTEGVPRISQLARQACFARTGGGQRARWLTLSLAADERAELPELQEALELFDATVGRASDS
jgi:hypothetical protein